MWNSDIGVFGGAVGNYALHVKYIFLGFLQGWFTTHPRYTWVLNNPAASKILILDKYSYNIATAGKKPAIIISRGSLRWMNTSIGQRESLDISTGAEVYSDLLQGNLSITCLSKEGSEAEDIASIVFNILTAYKRKLCSAGIHKIHSIDIGEEQVLRIDADPDVAAVTVTVQFTKQAKVGVSPKFYNIAVEKSAIFVAPVPDGDTDDYFGLAHLNTPIVGAGTNTFTLSESLDYKIVSGGSMIEFTKAPETTLSIISGKQYTTGTSDGTTPLPSQGALIEGQPSYSLSYLSAVSLDVVTQTILGDSSTTLYALDQQVYGYGPLLQEIVLGYSGAETDPTTYVESYTNIPPTQTDTEWFKVSGYDS